MLPHNRIATHPGIILLKEFLEPLGQTQRALAEHIGVPVQRLNEIVRGKRGVSPETSWLLPQALGTTPDFLHIAAGFRASRSRAGHGVQRARATESEKHRAAGRCLCGGLEAAPATVPAA